MTDTQVSPISQLLHTLGITREDLNRRSDQMRQFLTADSSAAPRVPDREDERWTQPAISLHTSSRSTGSTSSLVRSISRASSSSVRDGTPPPSTPVKPEPHDIEVPQRRMDNMEMVLERQRRQRKSRRGRERDSARIINPPPSPSPSGASQSAHKVDISKDSREDSRQPDLRSLQSTNNAIPVINDPPPVTPQKSKYYREHTNLSTDSASRVDATLKTETTTPTRPVTQQAPQSVPLPQYYAYPGYLAYPHYVPIAYRPAQAGPSSIPTTPQPQRTHMSLAQETTSPLPPSSPPPASSPISSPARGVNVVSSPGPMGPAPEENEYDDLPYRLPPGPYSPSKPELSYAALVGRAILSSPEHRLTLQEIYDWITIVYPHYKRGETTWMNSIRHVLSTTVCFRKVPRDRSVGRTLWAIYDEDLECFKDGGFKKQLCKDYVNGNDKEKGSGSAKGKAKPKKRGADDDELADGRKAKKSKKEAVFGNVLSSDPSTSTLQPGYLGPAPISSHPLFPPTRPTTHHQPYYQSCAQPPQTFPSEVIFPPLPPTAAFNRVVNNAVASAVSAAATVKIEPSVVESTESSSPLAQMRVSPVPSLPSQSSLVSSVPELTPNRNSSSPSSSLPATSEADIDMQSTRSSSADVAGPSSPISDESLVKAVDSSSVSTDEDDDSIFNTSLLGPVRFWGQSPKDSVLQPGIELLNFDYNLNDDAALQDKKGKKKQTSRKSSMFPPVPLSPTLNIQVKQSLVKGDDADRPTTPLPFLNPPSTPPRSTLQISSVRTPISHKGLHMSPSASLAHYKSNLDPPPAHSGSIQPLDLATDHDEDDPMRTPRKRLSNAAGGNVFFGLPVTPRRLTFPGSDSPFRTPMAGSPFRTPGSRSILDPHDPRTLLHEEFNNRAYDDSPGGIFGKNRGSLLYDSPGFDTPAKWWS